MAPGSWLPFPLSLALRRSYIDHAGPFIQKKEKEVFLPTVSDTVKSQIPIPRQRTLTVTSDDVDFMDVDAGAMPFLSSPATNKPKSLAKPPSKKCSSKAVPIQRHGPNDGVVTLNVGGKNFQTLRSTIAQNEVLIDHVLRAEANSEMVCGEAVFVDRDHKHFGWILEYLRNKADGVYIHPSVAQQLLKKLPLNGTNSNKQSVQGSVDNNCEAARGGNDAKQMTKSMSKTSFIELPTDSKTLTELYFESIYYNIPELTDHICCQ